MSYLGRGLRDVLVAVLAVLLAVDLQVPRLVAVALYEGHVVLIGAAGPRQDAHEVTVVAQVLQQVGHTPGTTTRAQFSQAI